MKVSAEAVLHDLNCGAKVGDSQRVIWKSLKKLHFATADVHMPTKAIARKQPLLLHILCLVQTSLG